ncbi:MAG: MBOAT family O-acyltransferase [Bacteroidota bacterium]|nr:MBOAT family O-acyltransferase [Bacteroidota bacterium]MDP3146156.1 MBOAT family O-acyltransferase [Bacteroidota bacterium]
MLFNTFDFLFLFFPLVTLVYYLLPHSYRWVWLLGASVYFYSYFIPYYLFILILAIVIDYSAGILIENSNNQKHKKYYLVASIISTVLLLFIFKYYNFAAQNINYLGSFIQEDWKLDLISIALPVGLSFHTFQSLSYVIEVYWGKQKAERHFGIYSLYVMFYPQLVAGPIERPQNVIHQFYEKHNFNWSQFTMGLRLMVWGLFKKVVIADNINVITNNIFENYSHMNSLYLYAGAFLFSIQIYCDFSGYSDMAIGSAKCMGFKLMENFNLPYISQSIKEFWSRWHISLSTWFRDYVYVPLGGSRISKKKTVLNQIYVFLISGIWHGANWTFLIWGALHALYNSIGHFLPKNSLNFKYIKTAFIQKKINQLVVFNLVLFAWIFFRANSLSDSVSYIQTMFSNNTIDFNPADLGLKKASLIILVLVCVLFLAFDRRVHQFIRKEANLFCVKSFALFSVLVTLIVTCGFWGKVQFIYFQF